MDEIISYERNIYALLLTSLAAVMVPIMFYIFRPALESTSSSKNVQFQSNNCIEVTLSKSTNNRSQGGHLLSLVIPAYNEEERLPVMLDQTLEFLFREYENVAKSISSFDTNCNGTPSFEIVIVDDGSSDGTSEVVKHYAAKNELALVEKKKALSISFRLFRLKQNQGKGAAIKAGVMRSTGAFVLMVDADGATDINDLKKLMKNMDATLQSAEDGAANDDIFAVAAPHAVVIGSRAHMQEESTASRTFVRTLLMSAFHMFVAMLCSRNVRDTQCGFKLFTRAAAITLFSNLHLQRWAFDIEIITVAEQLGLPLVEVGVNWEEIDGSKLDTSKMALLLASVGMLRDMLCVKLCYTFGIWNLPSRHTKIGNNSKFWNQTEEKAASVTITI